MSLWGRAVCVLLASIVMVVLQVAACLCVETPVAVSTGSIESGPGITSQIVRTSTGRLYHFSVNGISTGDGTGWIEMHTSADGQNWVKVDSGMPCFPGAGMAAAVDAANVIHMVAYDGSGRPSYQKFNSADSPKGDHTWEGVELIDKAGTANKGKCALAIDANGIPHLLYQVNGIYKGKHTTTFAYANRIEGVWNITVLLAGAGGSGFTGPLGIAVGPDNLPYIHMGKKILRGNANNPDTFETKELGVAYSFAIHRNGDVRVALASKGKYANQLHDHTQPWDKGWTLAESSAPDTGGVLVLAEDKPWLVTLEPDGLRVKKEFEPSRPAVAQPAGYAWKNIAARWSFYNHHLPWMIDMTAGSWDAALGNEYWYGRHVTRTVADFSVAPATGPVPLSVMFGNNSQPADGQIITLNEWDFENRGMVDSTEANPTHAYDRPGSYSARLTVTDSAGATDTKVMKNLVVADDGASFHPLAAVAALSVSTTSLPVGTVGSAYSQALAATGGTTPYTWSKNSGSLPAGLSLSSAGVISGTPTAAATSSFTVQVKGKNGKTATKSLSITINPASLAITTTTLPDGYLTTIYSQTLIATGGKTAYTWSITSGTLPAGLSLDASTGKISGTPTASGTSNITVQVKDSINTSTSKSLAITVYALPAITIASLPIGIIGTGYNQTLTSFGGKPPITWSISSGALPSGLSLNTSTGTITGTPTTKSSSSVTFKITDGNAKTASKAFAITINPIPPTITTTSLPDGYLYTYFSQTLSAANGKSPYSWSCASGSLPPGLSLSSSGVISGFPDSVGTSSFMVQVKDANNSTATQLLRMTVNPALSITTSNLPAGYVGTAYGQTITASGGKLPYSWSITSGVLPAGLAFDPATGMISGTPAINVSSYITVQVVDASNAISSGTYALTIYLPPSITTLALHDSFAGIEFSHTLSAVNGQPPYTWSISGGELPPGLSLDPASGTISGTPTAKAARNFTVQGLDKNSFAFTKAYSINITGFGSIAGTVTEQSTGAPLPGVAVTLGLSDIKVKNTGDVLFSCNGTPLAASDYDKIAANDDIKLGCYSQYYKVRNPYGATDPFTLRWNGLSAYYGPEYLAQSFKPSRSGVLNRVSFYYSGYDAVYSPSQGAVYVLLKSSQGGDRGVYLAHSTKLTITPETSTGWIDFDLTPPVQVTAGQEYVVEIQGQFPTWEFTDGYAYYDSALWGDGVQYADGGSYQRSSGVWKQQDNSLAFRTYVDASPDIVTALPEQAIDMHGTAAFAPKIYISKNNSGWEPCEIDYGNNGDFYVENNSADFSCSKTVATGSDYYDQNGWINVTLYSSSDEAPATVLATDQISLTFNRTFTTVTDANGAYFFPDLPDGNYTVTYQNTAYSPGAANGTLSPGQVVSLNSSLNALPKASFQGTITLAMGAPLAGVTVTVTDSLGTKSTISDSKGNYQVPGIAPGNYTITFQGVELQSSTQSGLLSPGQAGVVNVVMSPVAVELSITSPPNGAVVSVLPLAVAGTAQHAVSVNITATNNGTVSNYTANIINGAYSTSILLTSGQTKIDVTAVGMYGQSVAQSTTVTLAPFTVRNLGDTGNVTVMEVAGTFDAKNSDGSINAQPRQTIATEFFKSHPDSVDFLVFLSTFDYALSEAGAEGFYLTIKNDIQGINQPIFDNSGQFGSAGKLQGTIDLGNVTQLATAPFGPKLDKSVTTLNHELMHRFGAYVRYKNTDGTMNTALLGKDGTHWSYLLDTQSSIMYGNGWKNNGDGTFTSTSVTSDYNPLDLYLMGMIPKEQVPPMLLIDNPSIDKTQLPQLGATISGTAKTVTIGDIIAAEGARVPDSTASQKTFNVGFVLLTRSGDNPAAATQAIEILRKAWAGRFAELTQGAGGVNGVTPSITVIVDSPADGATVTGPDVTVTGSVINSSGVETGVTVNGMVATVSGSRFIANHVPLQSGANTITVTATDVNGLTLAATRSVTDQAGNYIRISSNIESGVAPLDVSLKLDGSFSIANPEISVSGPASITLTPGGSATEFTTKLTVEGTYTITASTVGPDGKTYTDSVTVLVENQTKIDTLLRNKWNAVNGYLASGNITKALSLFTASSKEQYSAIFNELASILPNILSTFGEFRVMDIEDGIARYKLIVNENGTAYAYDIEFVKEENGLWLLRSY